MQVSGCSPSPGVMKKFFTLEPGDIYANVSCSAVGSYKNMFQVLGPFLLRCHKKLNIPSHFADQLV